MTLEAFAASGATALGLALVFLYLMIAGTIVPGQTHDRALSDNRDLRESLKQMAASLDRRNDIDEDRVRREERFEDRRTRTRPGTGG